MIEYTSSLTYSNGSNGRGDAEALVIAARNKPQ